MAARRLFQKWIWIGLAGLALVAVGVLARFWVLPNSIARQSGPAALSSSPPPALPVPEAALPEAEEDPELSYETIEARREAAHQRMIEHREAARRAQEERHEARREERRKRKEERQAKRAEWREKREAFMADYPDPDRPAGPPFEEAPRGPAIYYEEGEEPPKGIPPAPYEKRPEYQGAGTAAGEKATSP
ncbi:MAG: hypothetical protein AB1405_17645 [Bdellovibrionota bacterium]